MHKQVKLSRAELDACFLVPRDDHPARRGKQPVFGRRCRVINPLRHTLAVSEAIENSDEEADTDVEK
jgi:hypothetical protein